MLLNESTFRLFVILSQINFKVYNNAKKYVDEIHYSIKMIKNETPVVNFGF